MAIRIRQHVNPLERKFQQPIPIPVWQEVYPQSDRPIHLDIGCARGKFLLDMAQLHPETNFLGIEIRKPLVEFAERAKNELGLTNLHYIFGNINSSASTLLSSLPHSLETVSVQFPDPWFKKKHHKRRVIQPELVTILVDYLAPEGRVFLQSDIEEVAIEMRDRFAEDSRLILHANWLETNPLPVPTERELYVLGQNLPVYRALLHKAA
jgi:tRNA (guanine-N7-)-methyltransferase